MAGIMEKFFSELILSLMVFVTVLIGIYTYQKMLFQMTRNATGKKPENGLSACTKSTEVRIGKRKEADDEIQADLV